VYIDVGGIQKSHGTETTEIKLNPLFLYVMTLEKNMTRLFDTNEFRRLKLPHLQEGATTPERPYTLTSGTPGPVIGIYFVYPG
jgi:hypothetical protein